MFSMMNLFGKRPVVEESNKHTTVNTLSKLKTQVDLLDKRSALLETKIATIRKEIVEASKTNKKKALILLDKKKRMDAEILKNEGVKVLLEKQINALESSVINRQVTDALREGNQMVRRAQTSLNPDQIEDLIDEIRETEETHQTIADAFSRNLQDVYDDPELMEELNDIVFEDRGKEEYTREFKDNNHVGTSPENIRMPNVSTTPILSTTKAKDELEKDKDEDAICKLRESMLV